MYYVSAQKDCVGPRVWSPVFTVEHIQPRHHGGRDTVSNLGLACESCNHRKGRKIDNLKENDPQRLMAAERLLTERRERLRAPLLDRRFGVLVPEVAGWVEKILIDAFRAPMGKEGLM